MALGVVVVSGSEKNVSERLMSVNITQQRICRVISQQMLYFSQHFAEQFCLENACRVMFTDICCHLTDMTFLGVGHEPSDSFSYGKTPSVKMVAWPSGLRRWFMALSWGREFVAPPPPNYFFSTNCLTQI